MRLVSAVLLFAATLSPALAQREPVIVVPGKPGVPVLMNGVDVSWAVIEGEFGLDRPGRMVPHVLSGPLLVTIPFVVPGYYPATGRRPGYGRLEIEPPPNRVLPPPAPTYYRNWSIESQPGPVTQYPSYPMPAVVVAPRFGRHGGGWGGGSSGGEVEHNHKH